MTVHSVTARQVVHISMVTFALLLRFLSPWQAAGFALTALLVNLIALPRYARGLFRPGEVGGVPLGGIVYYPLSVLVLIVVFPRRLDIVASAWGVLAAGDGFAGVVGRRVGGRTWPWNPEKTLAGSAAFVVMGSLAAMLLALWTRPAVTPAPSLAFSIGAPLVAATAAALVESMRTGLDDNLSVPFTAAATLWACSLVGAGAFGAMLPTLGQRLPWAIGINLLVAFASYRAGTVSRSGLLAGVLTGLVIFLGAGGGAWALLFAGFAAAAVTSRVGAERKAVLGITEDREGRRGAGNVLANCGLGALAAVLLAASAHAEALRLALVAALVAGASDTVASELGKAWGTAAFLPTTLKHVRPGTPGAMSVEGTTAGVAAALLLALVAAGVGLIPWAWVWVVVAAATIGALVESCLAATLEHAGVLDNNLLNFLNTAAAVAAAVLIVRRLG
jgi:uncharacterized protein (TIGR00297 family)